MYALLNSLIFESFLRLSGDGLFDLPPYLWCVGWLFFVGDCRRVHLL